MLQKHKKMKSFLFWIVLLFTICSRCRSAEKIIEVTLPEHFALEDVVFVHFSPEQISDNPLNASAICRVLPSSSMLLEEHPLICFSNMEQYGVRYANSTWLSCHVEMIESSVGMKLLTPILQNSCVLHPTYIALDQMTQEQQAIVFVENHAELCHASVSTMHTCKSIDNHAYMDLLSTYGFRNINQIVNANLPSGMKEWAMHAAVNLIKYYWKMESA